MSSEYSRIGDNEESREALYRGLKLFTDCLRNVLCGNTHIGLVSDDFCGNAVMAHRGTGVREDERQEQDATSRASSAAEHEWRILTSTQLVPPQCLEGLDPPDLVWLRHMYSNLERHII